MSPKQNYIVRAELSRQKKLASGVLADRYPEVSGIVICMTYYQKGNSILMLRTINLSPLDAAYFNMECMTKDCVEGGFDLTSVISEMVKARRKAGKGRLVCCGKSDGSPSDHASVAYEIGIQYHRGSR